MFASYGDPRARRRDRASIATGVGLGAGLGAIGGALGLPIGFVLGGVGALAGGVVGKLVALRISPEEWDPPPDRRPYVGVHSPDDDITST